MARTASPLRVLLRVAATISVAAALVAGSSVTASAAPSVAELEKQIDEQWKQLEPVIEQHNGARHSLKVNRKKIDELSKKIAPLQTQIDAAMNRVGAFAALAYKGGNATAMNSLLSSDTPETFTENLMLLEHFAREQKHELATVLSLREKYEEARRPIQALVDELDKQEKALAAKKKEIDSEIDKLQKLRIDAYGSTGGIGELRPVACPVEYPGGAAGTAAKFACAQIGKMYAWGSAGPNTYDCSGLVAAAWSKAGVSLPHNAAAQRGAIPTVSRANLRAGDLVFYYGDLHHVGMYVGGDWIVDAYSSGYPVSMRKLNTMPVHSYGRPG